MFFTYYCNNYNNCYLHQNTLFSVLRGLFVAAVVCRRPEGDSLVHFSDVCVLTIIVGFGTAVKSYVIFVWGSLLF